MRPEPQLRVIEYFRVGNVWRPHAIVTDQATWDACWSRRQGLLVHDSGSGLYAGQSYQVGRLRPTSPTARIWVAEGVALAHFVLARGEPIEKGREKPITTEAALRKLGWVKLKKLPADPFKDALIVDGHIEYCSICKDYMDDETPCEHMIWSDEATQLVGVGAQDSDLQVMTWRSFAALFDRLGAEGTRNLRSLLALEPGWHHDTMWDTLRDLREERNDCEIAVNYLQTISKERKVRRALREVVRLVDGWLLKAA